MTGQPWPAVTVVVATVDRPGHLDRTVERILAQDYPGTIECVVVYDRVPVRELAAPQRPGRALVHTVNSRTPGLPGGRNSGVEAGHGDLIAFCDDDDVWLPDKLRRQVELLAARPAAAAASCGIVLKGPDTHRQRRLARTEVTLADLIADRVMEVHSSTVLVRRSTWEAIGPVDEELPGGYSEDYEWLLRVAAHGPIALVPACLVEVNWHGGSFFFGRWAVIVDAQRYLIAKHGELAGSRTGLARIHGQIAFALAAGHRRGEALRELLRVVRLNPLEKRIWVTLPVLFGLLSGSQVLALAQKRGRGV